VTSSPRDREQELEQLRQRLVKRENFLFWGQPGAGKTLLMRLALAELSRSAYVYCQKMDTPGDALRLMVQALRDAGDEHVRDRLSQRVLESLSSAALRGLLRTALSRHPRMLVFDHVAFVSKQFCGFLKDVSQFGKSPLVTVARSHHMEEIGYLETLYLDRRTRLELENFDPPRASAFAAWAADAQALRAENREAFLASVVERSQGNPGAILRMIEMARHPRYRTGQQIRANILYVDYCVGSPGVRK
jgi:hypothetical protein